MHFALIHQAFLVVVQEFNGVLDRDHVLFALVIDLVEHGRQGGRFTGAGGAGDQHQTARFFAETLHHRRQAQRVKTFEFPRNGPKDGPYRAALIEKIASKTSQILQSEGKIQFQVFLEPMLLRVGQDAVGQGLGIRGGQGRHVQRPQFAVYADSRRAIGGDMQIASAHFDHLLEQFA